MELFWKLFSLRRLALKICLFEKRGNAEGGGYARQRRAVRVDSSALQKKI